jgi:uncharacterized protein (DUF885 family)
MKTTYHYFLSFCLSLLFLSCSHLERSNPNHHFEKIINDHWTWGLNEYPEWATYEGQHENDHKWSDSSFEALSRRHEVHKLRLKELAQIPFEELSADNQLNYRLFTEQIQQAVDGHQFPGHFLVINQLWSFHTQASRLIQVMPKRNIQDYENIQQRLLGVEDVLAAQKNLLQLGLEQGITPPKITLLGLPKQLNFFNEKNIELNPLTQHLFPLNRSLSVEEQQQIREKLETIFTVNTLPAIRDFYNFIEHTYVPGARNEIGWNHLPQGELWYQFLAKNHTTTDLTPLEIHQIGLNEVERIKKEMSEVAVKKAGYKDLHSYGQHLLTDSRYYFKTAEELLIHYQALCKRIDGEVARLFGVMPRTPYGVIDMPKTQAATSPAALYMGGNLKTGRAGQFLVNTSNLKTRPIWESEALALHEALPGHHLQISLAQELENVPEFRKRSRYTAYVEGWGLYAEALGLELGFYQEPSSDFGRLTFEMWRAVRLVVDTGLHAFGWTRDEAIDYFVKNSGRPPREAQIEIDRYIVRPGQALAYKIGEMKIWELRRYAESKLEQQFNIREFHDVILGHGAVSLHVLEEIIHSWVESQLTQIASNSHSPSRID